MQYTFEFDEAKSHANKRKHGIDFSEAQDIWRQTLVCDRHIPWRDDPAHLRAEIAPSGGTGI